MRPPLPHLPRAALVAALLLGAALPRRAHAAPQPAATGDNVGAASAAPLPGGAVPLATVTLPTAAPRRCNAVRLELRGAVNPLALGYERALGRHVGLFAAAAVPVAYRVTAGDVRLGGHAYGGTAGARFYPLATDAPFNGLTLSPFVDVTYLGGRAQVGSRSAARGATAVGVGATAGYSWTPGPLVLAVHVGLEVVHVLGTTWVLPLLGVGAGPTF